MYSKIANPKALGFGVLAIGLWMFSVIHAGIASPAGFEPQILHMVGTIAMLGLLIAGIAAFLRHEAWLGFFFLLWAGLFWGSGFAAMRRAQMVYGDMRYAGWFLMTIALVNFYLWYGVWKSGRFGMAVSCMLLLLWLSLLALGLHGFFAFWVLFRVSGALGLASALVAFYISAGAVATACCPGKRMPGIIGDEPERETSSTP